MGTTLCVTHDITFRAEPRRLQPLRPLLFCPRPFPGEAADSWIWRIGREFGYSPAKFLTAVGRPSPDPKDPGALLTKADVSYFATLARLPVDELAAMETIPAPWRLRAVRDQPFCAQCWLEDQRLHDFAYVRGSWMHAGRISCDRHGSWLYSVRDRLDPSTAIRLIARRTAFQPRRSKR